VTSASGDDDCEVIANRIGHSVDVDHSLAFLNPEELIAIRVDLLADLISWLESHHYELEMMPCVENLAKILVLDGPFLDVVTIAFHR
jgi:hypothetical protein